MKWRVLLTAASLSSLLLSGCGTDNNSMDDTTALRRNDDPTLRRVGYSPDNDTGNFSHITYPIVDQNNRTENQNDRNLTYRNVNNDDTVDRNGRNNTLQNVNNNGNRMTVADKAADKIVEMREVEQANVIVTDNNAYVAAKLTDNASNKLSSEVEKKISDLVKSTNQDIDQVYVSVNPDFYNRTTSYANDIRDGRPIEGFFDEFSTLVRRVFPTER
jgi:spore cortex protein